MDGQQLLNFSFLMKRKFDQQCKSLLLEYDLRQSDLDVLMFLATNPGCQTAREIVECRILSKSLVSSSVDALTRRGLLERKVDPTDRRCMLLTLLPPAQAIVSRTQDLARSHLQQLLSGVTEAELRTFERICAQVCRNLEALSGDPPVG